MRKASIRSGGRDKPKRFSGWSLAANAAVVSIGAAGAVLAAIPSLPLAVCAGVAGAVIAYTVTNEIPDNGKS